MLPATLLESHEFWQDEDDNVRGYPRDENASADVIYIRLGVGAHVAFHGARFDRVRVGGESLPPTRALVLRLKKSRLSAQRDATMAAIRALEDFTREKGLLSEPFTAQPCVIDFVDEAVVWEHYEELPGGCMVLVDSPRTRFG